MLNLPNKQIQNLNRVQERYHQIEELNLENNLINNLQGIDQFRAL